MIMNNKASGHKRTVINGLLTVNEMTTLSNNLIRIVFSCDKKLNVDPLWIGPHLKLLFPTDSGEVIFPAVNEENKVIWQEGLREKVRTYSVRYYDVANNLLTIDFVIHEKGIATTWAQHAKVNDTIGILGMGSKNKFDSAKQLVLLGDISAMPAICYTLEQLPKDQKAIAIIEVRSESDKVALNLSPLAKIEWIVSPQGTSQLIAAINQLPISTDDANLFFWGGMESSLSQEVRRSLKNDYTQLPADAIQLISYWREGYAEGEFKHHD